MKSPVLGTTRYSWQGWGALDHLNEAVSAGGADRVALLVSPSMAERERSMIEERVGTVSDTIVVPSALSDDDIDRLSTQVAPYDVVVGVGGGNVMDAAKGATRPGPARLVLVPTTLSGSEHSAETSWWHDGAKAARRVGYADAVITDPTLLVTAAPVLRCGALHAIAHCLATAAAPSATEWQLAVAADAAAELASVVDLPDDELSAARAVLSLAAWNAAVAFISCGPPLSAHHWTVHKLARTGEHARFSARLIRESLSRTSIHSSAIDRLETFAPDIRPWLSRVADGPALHPVPLARVQTEHIEPPDEIRDQVMTMVSLVGVTASTPTGGTR